MRTGQPSSPTPPWIVLGTAVVYFALGSVVTAHFMHLKESWVDSRHVIRLKIHQGVPDRMPVQVEQLRCAAMLQAQPSREAAKALRDTFPKNSLVWEYLQSATAGVHWKSTLYSH
jgi:hypothetical protein